MLRYMDNVSLVSVRYLNEQVFVPGSGVRRGTFIEDTFGKQTQMQVRLLCSALVAVQGGSLADHSPLPETARARVCCRNGSVLRILQRNGRLITAAFS